MNGFLRNLQVLKSDMVSDNGEIGRRRRRKEEKKKKKKKEKCFLALSI